PEPIRTRADKPDFDDLFQDGFGADEGRPLLALFEPPVRGEVYYRSSLARRWAREYVAGSKTFEWLLWPTACAELWLRALDADVQKPDHEEPVLAMAPTTGQSIVTTQRTTRNQA